MNNSILCLALAVYFESRSELLEGQVAVAQTILNRVESKHYPATVCGVVKQPKQFSFYSPTADLTPQDQEAWTTALAVAEVASQGQWPDLVDGALWYYNPNKVTPKWAHHLTETAVIGGHRFMGLPGEQKGEDE